MGMLFIALGVLLILLALSVRYIPSDPPHIAAVTFLGRRTGATKSEGYRLFPLYPFVYNGILVSVERENQELTPQSVRSRDLGEVQILVSVTWTPDPRYVRQYLNCGGRDRVRTAIESRVEARLRQWANERDWEEIHASEQQATAMLLRDLVGLPSPMAPEDEAELVRQVIHGNGTQPIPSLGIVLNCLDVRRITLASELVQGIGLKATKTRQRDAERVDIAHIAEIREQLGCSLEQAVELVHTPRGLVQKKIRQITGGLSPDTLEAVTRLLNGNG